MRSVNIEVVSHRKVVEPHFKVDRDLVKLSYLNFPNDKMSIAVFNQGKLLHEEKLLTSLHCTKALTFQN